MIYWQQLFFSFRPQVWGVPSVEVTKVLWLAEQVKTGEVENIIKLPSSLEADRLGSWQLMAADGSCVKCSVFWAHLAGLRMLIWRELFRQSGRLVAQIFFLGARRSTTIALVLPCWPQERAKKLIEKLRSPACFNVCLHYIWKLDLCQTRRRSPRPYWGVQDSLMNCAVGQKPIELLQQLLQRSVAGWFIGTSWS